MERLYRRTALLLYSIAAFSPAFGANVTGRIYSDQGRPVDNVLVSVQPTIAGPAGLPRYQAVTDAQGKFTINVPGGATYSVCAESPVQGLLNSCQWSLSTSLVQISAQAATAQMTLTLQTGTTMRFRLNDPVGLVPKLGSVPAVAVATAATNAALSLAATATPAVEFGLWDATGRYHVVPEVSGDEKGHNYEILVPPGASFHLSVRGSNLAVTDSLGSAPNKTVSATAITLGQTQVFQAAAPSAPPGLQAAP